VIVWVPRGGGQMEIVGHEPSLMFDSDDDAVEKIAGTLTNTVEQRRLRDLLSITGEQFSTTRFIHQVREVVRAFGDGVR
jgi:hypothetical protein